MKPGIRHDDASRLWSSARRAAAGGRADVSDRPVVVSGILARTASRYHRFEDMTRAVHNTTWQGLRWLRGGYGNVGESCIHALRQGRNLYRVMRLHPLRGVS